MASACGPTKRKRGKNEVVADIEDRTRDSTLFSACSDAKFFENGWADGLRDVVKEKSNYQRRAALLSLRHLSAICSSGGTVPEIDKNYFALCMRMVTSADSRTWAGAARVDGLVDAYHSLWGDHRNLVSAKYHGSIVDYAAIEMATAASNYNSLAIYEHQAMYLRSKYRLSALGHGKFMSGRICAVDPLNYTSVPDRLRGWAGLDTALEQEHAVFQRAKADGELTQYRYMMLQTIEAQNAAARREGRPESKVFTLLPVGDAGSKFVSVDLNTMRLLFSRFFSPPRRKSGFSRAKDVSDMSAEELEYWHMQDLLEARTEWSDWIKDIPERGGDWVQGKLVRSNGFELHFLYEKNKVRGAKRAKKVPRANQLWPQDWDPQRVFKNKYGVDTSDPRNCVAIDPGHHSLMSSATPTGQTHANGKPEMDMRSFTKRFYNQASKRNKKAARLRRRKQLHLYQHVQQTEALLAANTLKTTDLNVLDQAIAQHCDSWPILYDFYQDKQSKKLAFEVRQAEQRALDKMVSWVMGSAHATEGRKQQRERLEKKKKQSNKKRECERLRQKTVGFGDGSRFTGFRGCSAGGPLRRVRRHFVKKGVNVVLIREAYTSKRSPDARGYDMVSLKQKAADGSVQEIRGVQVCTKTGNTWNRDFAAAINIFDILFNEIVLGGPRPWHLNKIDSTIGPAAAAAAAVAGTWWSNFTVFPL